MKEKSIILINRLAELLKPAYEHKDEAVQAAWWLMQALTDKTNAQLIAHDEIELTQEQEKQLATWVKERVVDHKPLQYIIGWVPFDDVEIKVESPILIPRPETEEWVMNLIAQLKKLPKESLTILDIGCGSGAIALALSKALPHATIYAVDISDKAITLTKENATRNNIKNITILYSDLFHELPSDLKFDLIVSNPPYISSAEYKKLDPSVSEWEDKNALVAEHKGFAIIEKIIAQAPDYLTYNDALMHEGIGQLYIEIGYRQGNHAKELLQNALYDHIKVLKDLEGKDRVVKARVKKDVVAQPSAQK